MSWSLNFEVLHEMAYFVLMFCGHTIVSPSLTLPTNTTVFVQYNTSLLFSASVEILEIWRSD